MTEPYYRDELVTLYHGDCREIIPTLGHFDAVITDAPYGVNLEYDTYEDTSDNLASLVADVYPLIREHSDCALVFPGVGNIWKWPEAKWVLGWSESRPASGRSGPWGFTGWQPILAYGPDPYLKRGLGRRPDSIITRIGPESIENKGGAGHPCPKPLEIMSWAVRRATTSTTETVLDPFAGSGSTLLAARQHGRRVTGIELSERYCWLITRRLAQEQLFSFVEPFAQQPA